MGRSVCSGGGVKAQPGTTVQMAVWLSRCSLVERVGNRRGGRAWRLTVVVWLGVAQWATCGGVDDALVSPMGVGTLVTEMRD